jgi:hypothetical protein
MSNGESTFVPKPQPEEKQEYSEYINRMFDVLVQHHNVDADFLQVLSNRKKKDEEKVMPITEEPGIEQQFWELAVSLDSDSSDALTEKWGKLRKEPNVRRLYRSYPSAVETIVTACGCCARGRYSREQLNDAVEKTIQEVLAPQEASLGAAS